MSSRTTRTCRFVAVAALALLAVGIAPRQPVRPTASSAVADLHEARLRKMYLVRPDLISYPLMLDVLC